MPRTLQLSAVSRQLSAVALLRADS